MSDASPRAELPLAGPAGTRPVDAQLLALVPPVAIVDDDATSRAMADLALSRLGLVNPRLVLHDGGEAIEQLGRRARLGPPHVPALVLLDAQMPVASGMEVLSWMRRTVGLEAVPVVVLSADDSTQAVKQAYDLGAVSYLVKPVGYDALETVVRGLVQPWMLL